MDCLKRHVPPKAALAQQEQALTGLVVFLTEDLHVSVSLVAGSAVVAGVRVGQFHRSALGRLPAASLPRRRRGACRPGLLAASGQLGAGGVKVAFGALGPGAQLAARFLEHLGAGFQRGAQLVPLAGRVGAQLRELGGVCPGHLGQALGGVGEPGEDLVPLPVGVGAQLLELAGGVFPDPRGLRAGVLGAGLRRGGALICGLGGLPVLLGLLAYPVPVGLGGADEGLGVGADPAGQFLGLPLGLGDAGLGGADRGVGVGLGPPDRLVRLGACLADGLSA